MPVISLPDLARSIAVDREASIVLLQIKPLGSALFHCEDAASLCVRHGRESVLAARVVALKAMLDVAVADLQAERVRRAGGD